MRMENVPMQIGTVMRKIRESAMTQDDIAEKLGTHQAQVSRWERGLSEPSFEELALWEDALGRPRGTVLRTVGIVEQTTKVEDAIRSDGRLDAAGVEILLQLYKSVLSTAAVKKPATTRTARRK